MKFILSFLSICVALSHQQHRDQILMLRPWMTQFYQPSTFNDYHPRNRIGIYGDSRVNFVPIRHNDGQMDPISAMNNDYESSGFVQSRNKNSGQQGPFFSNHQDELLNRRLNRNNFVTRTATFTITSTCTSIRYSSCVPRAYLLPVAPLNVTDCWRKREIDSQSIEVDEESQFPIIATQVALVLPTVLTSSTNRIIGDGMEITPTHIVSSKEDNETTNSGGQLKMKRYLYWTNHISSTTTTSWSVVSTILTRTFIPSLNFDCLPPGYAVCP